MRRWWAGCSSGRWSCCSTSRPRGGALARLRQASCCGSAFSGSLASLWWIVPLLVHVRYGIDFLQFTEQPRTIWSTNSVTEALRLMALLDLATSGYGFHGVTRPVVHRRRATLLFNPLVVGASLLVPALALTGLLWTRRFRYAPFFLLLAGRGGSGRSRWPGSRRAHRSATRMEWVYKHVFVLRFMRTTQKAAPLVAMGVAGLLGLGGAAGLGAAARAARRTRPGSAALVGAPVALAALIVLAALPLVRGTAIERQVTWDRDPGRLDGRREGPRPRRCPRTRARMVLPGQVFALLPLGRHGRHDPAPLTDRPVAVRYETALLRLHAGGPAGDGGRAGPAAAG